MSESRQHPRKHVVSSVVFQIGDGPRIAGECRDLSLGGMYLETSAPQPYGTAVRVFVQLPGLKQETEIASVVRWAKPTGMGVQFGRMGARETHALTLLLGGG